MILGATGGEQFGFIVIRDSTHVREEIGFDLRMDDILAILGGEYDVDVKGD